MHMNSYNLPWTCDKENVGFHDIRYIVNETDEVLWLNYQCDIDYLEEKREMKTNHGNSDITSYISL